MGRRRGITRKWVFLVSVADPRGRCRILRIRHQLETGARYLAETAGYLVLAVTREKDIVEIGEPEHRQGLKQALEEGDWTLLAESGEASTARMAVDYYARPPEEQAPRDKDDSWARCEVYSKVKIAARLALRELRYAWRVERKRQAAKGILEGIPGYHIINWNP